MDFSTHVLYCVIHHFVLEFVKALVGFQRVSEKRRTGQDMLSDFGSQGLFLVLSTTLVRTFPPRSKIPMTAALSVPPVPVIRRGRFSTCMLRAFPSM